MRSRTTTWFEVTVRYNRQAEDGGQKRVTEYYAVDALSFSEAEETITREMTDYVSGEFEVKKITPAAYGEVFFSDMEQDDRWYKVKLVFTIYDEKTDKEKRSIATYLVQAGDFRAAMDNIDKGMHDIQSDYIIANMAETKIMEVFEHKASVDVKNKTEGKEA